MNAISIKELAQYFGMGHVTDCKKKLRKMGIYPIVGTFNMITLEDAEKAKKNWI